MKEPKWSLNSIIEWARKKYGNKYFKSQDLVNELGMSRSTAARILTQLTRTGRIIKIGSTQTAKYSLNIKQETKQTTNSTKLVKQLRGLAEDIVFSEVNLRLSLQKYISENGLKIANYAFCEMLNNAIDHSKSNTANIQVKLSAHSFEFNIRDSGIGIFNNIKKGFNLNTDEEAIEHLLKGKQTTAPEAHSGQGIFFTSKIADQFFIRSGRFKLTFDNPNKDIRLGHEHIIKGTEVFFRISRQPKKRLQDLFEEYANEDFEFDRTKYPVIILNQEGVISRSQARRLLVGLEKFDRIILNFAKVKELGQGFADEIFRVHHKTNPSQIIEAINANAAVHFMIARARK